MNGYLVLAGGRELRLPPASSWKLCYTDGEPCDCFEFSCPLDESCAEMLETAQKFRAENDGDTVFVGVLDESVIALGSGGMELSLCGRGMGARLMDNQPGPCSYTALRMKDIIDNYITPYGVEVARCDDVYASLPYEVSAADTCWKVLKDFSLRTLSATPRFTKEGRLVISKTGDGQSLSIGRTAKAMLTLKRYGVISELFINQVGSIYSDAALSRGINCRKVTTDLDLAAHRLQESEDEYFTLEVTVPYAFAAYPEDRVTLDCGPFSGTYRVKEAQSSLDSSGHMCKLILKMEE